MTETTMTTPTTEQLALTTIASIGDTLTRDEAAAILGCSAADLDGMILAAVTAHGEREGRADYEGRAEDVAAGLQPEDWAWPMTSSDEAYLNAVGTAAVCREIGIDVSLWDDVSSAWLAAFARGYERAHEAA